MLKRKYYSKFRKSDNTAIIKCLEVEIETRKVVKIITAETNLETPDKTIKKVKETNLDFDEAIKLLKFHDYTFIGE